jgi:hypothetical protein
MKTKVEANDEEDTKSYAEKIKDRYKNFLNIIEEKQRQ